MTTHIGTKFLAIALICTALPLSPGLAGDRSVTITLLGDNFLNGGGLNPPDRFAARLSAALGEAGDEVTVESAGYQQTTRDGVYWLTKTSDGQALLADPSEHAVILELGQHDCGVGGTDLTLEKTRANFDQMLNLLQAKGIPVLLVGADNFGDCGAEYSVAYRAMLPEVASKHALEFYPDFVDGIRDRLDLRQAEIECVHPNELGEEVVVQRMLPMVKTLVEQVAKVSS